MGVVQLLLHKYGYLALVLILALDSSGVPWPTELTLAAAGAGAQEGVLPNLLGVPNFVWAWTSSLVGASMGSSLSYYLGRRMGPKLMRRIAGFFHLSSDHMDKVDQWFEKHGHRAVFFGRLVPFVRNFTGYPAGVMEVPFGKYLLFSLAGYGVYDAFALSLGFGGTAMARWVAEFEAVLWIVIPVAALFVWFKWGRKFAARLRGRG